MSGSTADPQRGLDLPTDPNRFLSVVRPLLKPEEYEELERRVASLPRETHEAHFLWHLVLDHSGLKLAQRSLLRSIVDLGRGASVEWPIDTLARRTGMARATAAKKIAELGELRWLAVERRAGERYRLRPTVPTASAVADASTDTARHGMGVTPHHETVVTPHQQTATTPSTKAGGQGDQGYKGDHAGYEQTPPPAPRTVDRTVFRAAMTAVERYLPPIREFEIKAEVCRLLGRGYGYQDPDEWSRLAHEGRRELGTTPEQQAHSCRC